MNEPKLSDVPGRGSKRACPLCNVTDSKRHRESGGHKVEVFCAETRGWAQVTSTYSRDMGDTYLLSYANLLREAGFTQVRMGPTYYKCAYGRTRVTMALRMNVPALNGPIDWTSPDNLRYSIIRAMGG